MSIEDRPATGEARLLCGRYRLGALLGRGGAGRVYEALDVLLGRPVAVKVFQPGGNAVGRFRFAAEARMLAGLSHPALVTVYDVCLDGDEPFLVMRLVNGPTLRDVLDRGPLDPAPVARIGARLADALAYVHAHDVVHRDVKPSNVLVDEAGECHLADFGVARALNSAHLTVSSELVGTAAYLAPEQITQIDVGPAADIYALGLVLLECLTGHTEYTGSTIETALARLNRPPRISGSLPAPWCTLLTAMTAQDPAARPDAGRCAEVLTAIAHGRTKALDTPLLIPAPRQATNGDTVQGEPVARPSLARLPRPRPVLAGLTALALAAACALAATTATTTPGRPTGEPHDHTPATTSVVPSTAPAGQSTTTSPPADVQDTVAGDPRTRTAPANEVTAAGNPGNKGQGVSDNPGNKGHGKDNRAPGKAKGKSKGKG